MKGRPALLIAGVNGNPFVDRVKSGHNSAILRGMVQNIVAASVTRINVAALANKSLEGPEAPFDGRPVERGLRFALVDDVHAGALGNEVLNNLFVIIQRGPVEERAVPAVKFVKL